MSEQVQPGDIVKLKSDGPTMVIGCFEDGATEPVARCYWFVGNDLREVAISISALVKTSAGEANSATPSSPPPD